ncbi:MAG: hypothetical protein IH586_22400, partial [Anaerolineaceae bacterium]|nr:hypothetical protein [Anaerolineaceae bacterium]
MQISSQVSKLAILRQRKDRTERWIAIFQKVENRFPWIRLAILVTGLLCILVAFQLLSFLLIWLAVILALLIFAIAAFQHNRLVEQIKRLKGFLHLLETHIARLELDWDHIPSPSDIQVPIEHPFGSDLNVTGSRSLHQLLDTSISLGGSHRLASWLLQSVPDPDAARKRQNLVQDLLPSTSFRTQLELSGMLAKPDSKDRWDATTLQHWLEKSSEAASLRPLLITLGIFALANMTLYGLNALGLIPPIWIGTIVIYLGLQSFKYRESSEVFNQAYELGRQLGQLRPILAELETYPYAQGSLLEKITLPITQSSQRPSTALRQISQIISAASLRNNPFLVLILNLLVPWDIFFVYQLERYKLTLREKLPIWLETWYELEGLVSVANYAALHPENSFPIILPYDACPILELKEAGHPLIPAKDRVANNFTIQQLGEIVLVTGSNMSGKSTFLRTVGVNLILTFVGSPVPAQKIRCVPFRLYTSMNMNDSLNDGISFFYAEVRRLKALLDGLESDDPSPLLFLIDEIFRGTNN